MDPATIALTYGPLIAKLAFGLLPANAAATVGKVVETVRNGLEITKPVLSTLDSIAGLPEGDDISLAQMDAALAAMNTAGIFEEERAKVEKP